MGMSGALRQSKVSSDPIVAFDFDGTLTCRDSFLAFLVWRAGGTSFLSGLASLGPAFLAYALRRDRGELKGAFVRQFLGGVGRAELEIEAETFARDHLDALIRPDALIQWRAWREKGAKLFIVTASPEILVAPFARALEADGLIGTRLAVDGEGRTTGGLVGRNCRGPEKVARLRERLGDDLILTAAYGDSSGDREMLELAGIVGMKIFNGRRGAFTA
jgi:phosphatidylglycerophosphatase C